MQTFPVSGEVWQHVTPFVTYRVTVGDARTPHNGLTLVSFIYEGQSESHEWELSGFTAHFTPTGGH